MGISTDAGDIIQCVCETNLFGNKLDRVHVENYEVKWESDKCRWGRYKNEKFEILSGLEKEYIDRWYTVIGNIYQNPELLNEEED